MELNTKLDSLRIVLSNERNQMEVCRHLNEKADRKISDLSKLINALQDSFIIVKNLNEKLNLKNREAIQKIVQQNIKYKQLLDSINNSNPEILKQKIKDSVKHTILFYVQDFIDSQSMLKFGSINSLKLGVPILMYKDGKYIDLIPGIIEDNDEASVLLNTNVKPYTEYGKILYGIKEGKKSTKVNSLGVYNFGYSDWSKPSFVFQSNNSNNIFTNNPYLGLISEKKNNTKVSLKPRANPYGGFFKSELLDKIDLDLDGFSELIFKFEDFEGFYFAIYSFKENKWNLVFNGGYQGN